MKYLTLLAILTIIAGCSLQSNNTFSVDEITQCISENTIEICQSKCNGDISCQQRVDVIAKEKFGNEAVENKTEDSTAVGTQNLASDETQKNKHTENNETQKQANKKTTNQDQEEIEKLRNNETQNDDVESKDETAEQTAPDKTEEQTQQNNLVTLSGFSCDNKDGLPDKMKVFAERVDIKKWDWIVPYGGEWELTELEPGQYKIYYAPERNTEPLAKYSEFIADGNGNHDYKILDLTNGGEVRNLKPCDWE